MALFTRPAPAAAPETWMPEGTIVSQRYRALEGATVLVYTADTDQGTARYAAACLGCTHRRERNASGNVMTEAEAAQAANAHATACRAVPRGIPARPDDTEAAKMIRTRLWARRYGTAPHQVRLSDFTGLRVDLQRPTDWIKAVLSTIALADPGFLAATPANSGQGTRFTVQPFDRP
ncbi:MULTISPECIES: hypothetical protein [unclassified Streptomyces]|uniref:hypothetical protein n=1 Tax=unclassified Streptomyces TaxID=2593676 RepID=UPI00190D1FF6|nr:MULTISPECIES: hypothetical protein [unclassified Streptomyces]MBK3603266.1 hypothetical protein [Streptomyces sp. MBT54]MBK3645826.1 hypothetical protein [Streptomyces sp. MBT33]